MSGILTKTSHIRACFWFFGLVIGCLTAYSGRYFQNNDATVYIEMGEAVWAGRWWDAVNFTFSPVYAILVRLFQEVVPSNPENEIIRLKLLNILILVVAMASFEAFMTTLRRSWEQISANNDRPLDWSSVCLVSYSVFLVAALVSVRTRLLNPDMMVMAISFLCCSIILSIAQGNQDLIRFAALGMATGLGYLTKAFFFLYSPALIFFAGISCSSLKRAISGSAIAVIVAFLVSGPLITGLSVKKGSFSYGEGGRHVYAILFGSAGSPENPGRPLNEFPKTVEYEYGDRVTRPLTYDVTYWTIGVKPVISPLNLLELFIRNVAEVFTQSPWILFIMAWFLFNISLGSLRIGPFVPASAQLTLLGLGALGIALFALVAMEPRYIAPFICFFSSGLCLTIRTHPDNDRFRNMNRMSSLCLAIVLVLFVFHSAWDQSVRGLISNSEKPSYKESYEENVALKEFLSSRGIRFGDKVAVIGSPPTQWARIAGLRITGEILFQDEFLNSSTSERIQAIESLRNAGYKAVIAIGKGYGAIPQDGWTQVPGTRHFYVATLQ